MARTVPELFSREYRELARHDGKTMVLSTLPPKFSQPLDILPPKMWQKPHGPSLRIFKPCASMSFTYIIWLSLTITRTAWAVFKYCGTKTVPLRMKKKYGEIDLKFISKENKIRGKN